MTKRIEFKEKPYFIYETEGGLYQVVSAVLIDSRESARYEPGQEEGLRIGEDIVETPNEGITLALESPPKENPLPHIIAECRKYARISWHEYVTVDISPIDVFTIRTSGMELRLFSPRLFRIKR